MIDPAAESMNSWSPYNYTFNNPIIFTDPDGAVPDYYLDQHNNVVHVADGRGELEGTSLRWIAPESATVAGSTTLYHGENGDAVGFGRNIEMSESEVYTSEYSDIVSSMHETTDKWGTAIAYTMMGEFGGAAIGALMRVGGKVLSKVFPKLGRAKIGNAVGCAKKGSLKKGPKNLLDDGKAAMKKKAKQTERIANRNSQTVRGNNRTGNSNQDIKGSHNSGGKKPGKHDKGNARRARDQGVKGPEDTK